MKTFDSSRVRVARAQETTGHPSLSDRAASASTKGGELFPALTFRACSFLFNSDYPAYRDVFLITVTFARCGPTEMGRS